LWRSTRISNFLGAVGAANEHDQLRHTGDDDVES
jgi:hypothetical protein